MRLKKLAIINYKNIKEATLELSPNINCLIGSNGMGKTNILDAVYYLSFCKSHTSSPDSQLVRHEEDFFVLDGLYEDDKGNEEQIYCGMKRGTRKHFKRNKKEYKRLSQHIGLIPLIIVSPGDTVIIDGGSEHRRRFMDVVIAQCQPEYMDALTRYGNALQQRNALLKMEEEPDSALLGLWEEEMAREGERIYGFRNDFIERLIPLFRSIYDHTSGSHETVGLKYISHCQRGPLLDIIRRDRHKDRAIGYSLHGVHRDDLEMTIDGYPLRREGSQGQTKTFVIAMKLAQFDFLRKTASNTTPLLLLDDIFDKLDASRVEQIVKLVAGNQFGQIFITDTNRDHLDEILSHTTLAHKIFHINEGEVS
ncbi:MAG: DNA replication and repair protein RecF [Bacteroidales bacterium]|nr:DNA replication and repair protein RecF [Bacteroidales bacterium]MCM1146699.1 DNA replication and repair protein RecF [Bacteroidales bacterium]MCM1205516.1 DNA replication and repair protein RecF [Bacillota bacterium]MCM1509223.1 DNA replication and repair protein RecF [Clostridium sp.]